MKADVKTKLFDKVISISNLSSKLDQWRLENKKIVFTNGCFDLLHAGHIAYLTEAAALGDVLILGLNSDSSVQKLKGPERPINNEETRTTILASMFFIDAVVVFDDETPLKLIKTVLPNVLVKGGDYKIADIVGARETIANGGEVKVLTFLQGYSSTGIVNKIREI